MNPVLTFWLIRPFQYQGINHFIIAIIISILDKDRFTILKKKRLFDPELFNISDFLLLILK